MTPELSGLVNGAHVFDLGQTLSASAPYHPNYPPFTMALQYRHGDWTAPTGMTFASELIFMTGHTGTHVDAIGHCVGHAPRPGASEPHATHAGLQGGSVDQLDPIVGRGVLLDCAGHAGVDCLPDDHRIDARELEAVAGAQGIDLRPGDSVLIRTGRGRFWDDAPRFFDPDGACPGPTGDACRWLAEQEVGLAGTDTLTFEYIDGAMEEFGAGHLALFAAGIPIVECLALEELAAQRAHEFLFVLSPLKIVGGTGSPVRPLAVVSVAER